MSGGGTRSGRKNTVGAKMPVQVAATPVTPAAAPAAVSAPAPAAPVFSDKDSNSYHMLANETSYFAKQTFNDNTKRSIRHYLSPDAVPGSLYSESQVLNHALRQGIPLTRQQKKMRDGLNDGMHNLGENLELTRYCRVNYMKELGIANYDRMSIKTLKKRLIGQSYSDKAFLSVSCNNFSKAPKYNSFTDKAVKLNIKAPASTKALMPGTGKGGDFGELVLGPNQNYRITDLRWTGKQGRSGANYYKQIELDIEMF